MNKYKLLNTYILLSAYDEVEPLTCPDCGNVYSVWIPDGDQELENPVLKCWTCNSEVTPGTQTLTAIEEAVKNAGIVLNIDKKD